MKPHRLLGYFGYAHLPVQLRDASAPFAQLAERMAEADVTDPEQRDLAIQCLLQAKDAFVRACLQMPPAPVGGVEEK